MTPTQRALIKQLTENTGIAMCDSGGASGRHWQRNQGRDFLSEPATTLCFSGDGEIDITHNIFHWLIEQVEYDADMTRKFKRLAASKKYEDSSWMEIIEVFAAKHGATKDNSESDNTYNGEDLLSQGLQYCLWYSAAMRHVYVALQPHQGADVRGGYASPVIYQVAGNLRDNARASIICPTCRAEWNTYDGGYSWEPYEHHIDLSFLDQRAEFDRELPFPAAGYGRTVAAREPWPIANLCEYQWVVTDEFLTSDTQQRGIFYIDAAGNGLCPYCLTGTLAGFS